jgi:hypothetical protein
VTDGHHVYMRGPVGEDNRPLHNYTLMPTHMRGLFGVQELQELSLAEPFLFTKNCRTLKIPSRGRGFHHLGNLLFDVRKDPEQKTPIQDPEVEARMIAHLGELMRRNDAPAEQYERLGLPKP